MPSAAFSQQIAIFIRSHELCAYSVGTGSVLKPRSSTSTFPRMCYLCSFCQILYISCLAHVTWYQEKKKIFPCPNSGFPVSSWGMRHQSTLVQGRGETNLLAHVRCVHGKLILQAGRRQALCVFIRVLKLSCKPHRQSLLPAKLPCPASVSETVCHVAEVSLKLIQEPKTALNF